jgi:hypothetical protein
MALGQRKRAVGVFPSRQAAEYALHELRDSGFPMDRVSVVARDADRNDDIAGAEVRDRVGNKADEGAVTGAVAGGTLGGLTGLLVGLGMLAIPGIGPVMLAGATATAIATTLSGAGIGAVAGSLIGALIGLGIPEERARVYNERVSRGEYLVIIDGNEDELRRVEAILHSGGIQEFGIYDAPDGDMVRPEYVAAPEAVVPGAGLRRNKYAVGYFPHLRDAEQAIGDLRAVGFPLSQISLVAKKFERREPFAGVDLRDRFDAMRIGLPDERARFYNDQVTRGEYVVIVDGTDPEIQRAAAILSNRGIQEWQIYDPTTVGSTPSGVAAGTPLNRHRRAVGLFPNRRDAEVALVELRDSGFPMDRVSVIAKHADRDDDLAGADVSNRVGAKTGNKAGQSAAAGAATGGALGGLGGLLVGLGTLAIPGVGPVIAGGAAATALSTALAGGAIGAAAGGITGGLVGLGIPDERAKVYDDRVARGYYLVMVDGNEDEIRLAEGILNRHGIQDYEVFDARGVNDTHPGYDYVDSNVGRSVAVNDPNARVVGNNPDEQVVTHHPDVIIIDHRHQTP